MTTTQPGRQPVPAPDLSPPAFRLPEPYPADPQESASRVAPSTVDSTSSAAYTATDAGTGITSDSVQAWQEQRGQFSTFVRAQLSGVTGAAGPDYPSASGQPVAPTLVLTDDAGRTLALNGMPCGFDGEGPRAAAQVMVAEGLLSADSARAEVGGARELDLRRPVPARTPDVGVDVALGVLPDAVAQDPAVLEVWSAQFRWQQACSEVDPRLPTDPHYPALAAALERVDAAGVDARAALTDAASSGPLPERNPGRALHFRLVDACDAAAAPAPAPTAPTAPPAPRSEPPPARPAPSRGAPRL